MCEHRTKFAPKVQFHPYRRAAVDVKRTTNVISGASSCVQNRSSIQQLSKVRISSAQLTAFQSVVLLIPSSTLDSDAHHYRLAS
jgi:hypothetical protein